GGGTWAAGTQPSIPLTAALPLCVEPTAWTAVAPVSRLHYGLESDLNPEFARLRANTALPGSRRMLLVRREENTGAVRPQDATALSVANAVRFATLANTARIVLDYAVEFGISAVHNTQLTQTARPTWNYAITPAELAAVNVAPQNFRSLIVTVSARSSEVDPRLGPVGGTRRMPATGFLGDPLLTFNVVDPDFTGLTALQARVRTLRAEIFLHNL
ncbi:MAG TPA: hypothetical protein VFX59_19060, partial [Polyangiales bacterium]|nr:hypothetical protein [Polyangiales bacterium]